MVLVAIATVLNVAIVGTASYRGVEYMGSNAFCGTSCHTVMAPQYTAFLDGPHSRVGCVQCHIGEGASWFVRSKLSCTRQVFAVSLDTFSRPIPSPVEHLRPARETCRDLPGRRSSTGTSSWCRAKYADDEASTASTTVLVVKVGGRGASGGNRIHGHHLDRRVRSPTWPPTASAR